MLHGDKDQGLLQSVHQIRSLELLKVSHRRLHHAERDRGLVVSRRRLTKCSRHSHHSWPSPPPYNLHLHDEEKLRPSIMAQSEVEDWIDLLGVEY